MRKKREGRRAKSRKIGACPQKPIQNSSNDLMADVVAGWLDVWVVQARNTRPVMWGLL